MADVSIVIGVDNKGAITGLKQVGDSADDAGQKAKGLGGHLADVGKIAGGIVIAKAFTLGASAINDAFSAAADYQKMQAATNAVIESTGGKAGISAKEVVNLANSLEKMTAIDDQVIQGAENLLLTFTNIGKDVFPEATKTVLNMSVALGQDTKSSAIQLGKALNDPIKGITALSRVGVSFTEDQKKMIKGMVEAGDTMGAQKIILKELETEFGGAAEAAGQTLGGQLSLLKDTISDTFRDIAVKALPTLVELTSLLAEGLTKGIDLAGTALGKLGDFISPVVDHMKDFIGDIQWVIDNGTGFNEKLSTGVWATLAEAIGGVAILLRDKVIPAFKDLLSFAWDKLKDGAEALGKLAGLAWDGLQKGIDALKDLVSANWGNVKEGAAALKEMAQQKFDQLAPQFDKLRSAVAGLTMQDVRDALKDLKDKAQPAIDVLQPLAERVLKALKDGFDDVKEALKPLGPALDDLLEAVKPLEPVLKPLGIVLGTVLVVAAGALLLALEGLIKLIAGTLTVTIQGIILTIEGLAKAIDGVVWAFKNVIAPIAGAVGDLVQTIEGPIGGVISFMYSAGEYIVKGLWNGITAWAGWLKDNIGGWAGGIIDAAKSGFGVRSPSKEFHYIGEMVVEGFANGLEGFNNVMTYWDDKIGKWVSETAAAVADDLYANVPDYVKQLSPAAGGTKDLSTFMSQYEGGGQYGLLQVGNKKVGDIGPNGTVWNGTSYVQNSAQGYTGNLPGGSQPQTIIVQIDGKEVARAVNLANARAGV